MTDAKSLTNPASAALKRFQGKILSIKREFRSQAELIHKKIDDKRVQKLKRLIDSSDTTGD